MMSVRTTWVDHGVTPPQRLPVDAAGIAVYLTEALGHPIYERWTWKRMVDVYGALPDARLAKPLICRLLIDAPAAIDAWQRGRLRAMSEAEAPQVEEVVEGLLKVHSRRFKVVASSTTDVVEAESPSVDIVPAELIGWLQRTGRFKNPHPDTNTLGASDDRAALAAFLRERATRSRHTWRAYTAELQRLVDWCAANDRGPLSDLTRQDLLAYAVSLRRQPAPSTDEPVAVLSERSRARALAVVASLFRHWHDTGYLLGNPAVGLTAGAGSRAGFAPTRFVPLALLQACDAWVARSLMGADVDLVQWRRAAVWTLYRYSGVRLCELAWHATNNLPHLEVDDSGAWLLTVLGKGDKERTIPLPSRCDAVLRTYRVKRGLPLTPNALEQVPLIHGEKGGALGERGLYEEVKAVLHAVGAELLSSDAAGAALLQAVSPHWLRHAYARTLVVDKRVPLPAAQALLGHASVQTTAAYAKTDMAQLRSFVEQGFE